MTDKQKKAITLLNELRYERKTTDAQEYFFLLEFVIAPTTEIKYDLFPTEPHYVDPFEFQRVTCTEDTTLTKGE